MSEEFVFQSVLPDNNFKCDTMLPNKKQCSRKVSRILNNRSYCEGHFQVLKQTHDEHMRQIGLNPPDVEA